jgi:hypothetical protein
MDSPRVDDELAMVMFDPRRKFCLDIETEGSIPAEEDKINSNSERWIPGDQVFFENEQSPLFSPPTTGCTRIADGSDFFFESPKEGVVISQNRRTRS